MTQLLVISVMLLIGNIPVVFAQNLTEDERLFKAAFIFNFAKFTQWPENTLDNPDNTFNLCTAGIDQLILDLKRLGGKSLKQKPVKIFTFEEADTCHLLYIGQSEKEHYEKYFNDIANKPVLTISELPGFAYKGGIVELYRDQGRTGFIINLGLARDTKLTLSSRLLKLAKVINNEENL